MAHALDTQLHSVSRRHLFALMWEMAEGSDEIAADRFELFVREMRPELGVDVFNVDAGIDDRFARIEQVNRLFFSLIVDTQGARQDDCYRSCPSEDLTGRLCSR